MNNNKTDITVVLDRSGSMATVADDTKGGFDKFIEEQKKAPGEAVLTLVQFDTVYEFVHKARPIKDVPALDFMPRGGTALLDAIGRAISETGERLKNTAESERPGKVVFVIITDGHENSSMEYTKPKIKEMIQHQTDLYKWHFVFLGANQDAIQEGAAIGIAAGSSMNYNNTNKNVHAVYAAAANNLTMLRSGLKPTMDWSEEDRAKAVEK